MQTPGAKLETYRRTNSVGGLTLTNKPRMPPRTHTYMHLHHLIHTCTIPPPFLAIKNLTQLLVSCWKFWNHLNYISIYSSIFTFCQSRNTTFLAIPAMEGENSMTIGMHSSSGAASSWSSTGDAFKQLYCKDGATVAHTFMIMYTIMM